MNYVFDGSSLCPLNIEDMNPVALLASQYVEHPLLDRTAPGRTKASQHVRGLHSAYPGFFCT